MIIQMISENILWPINNMAIFTILIIFDEHQLFASACEPENVWKHFQGKLNRHNSAKDK